MATLSALVLFGAISLSSGLSPETFLFQQQEKQEQPLTESEKEARAANEILREVSKSEIDIVFTGNRVFSQRELLAALKYFYDTEIDTYGIEVLEADLQGVLRLFLGNHGYIQARIDNPAIERLGQRVRITVPINEGLRYRIGKLSIKGAKLFSEAKILEISGMKTGEIISSEVIQDRIYQGIKDAYEEYGYAQASAEFIHDIKPALPWSAEAIVDATIEIDEGKQFFVESIEFLVGEDEKGDGILLDKKDEWIRHEIYLEAGQIYNERLLKASIERLNQLGLFEEITWRNVATRTNDRNNRIEISISLKKKNN